MTGLVIKTTGNAYEILLDTPNPQGETTRICKPKGNFRLKGIRTTNPIAVGDHVTIDGEYITAIAPRRNYIIRRASNLSKESHILAANIDQAALVATLAHPVTSTVFIDRFLATAEAYQVKPLLIINKIDLLLPEPDGPELLQAYQHLYSTIGYTVIPVSAKNNTGIQPLLQALQGKTTLIAGNSGVGKTTLINTLIPGLNLRTGHISDIHDTGMHTTTFSESFPLPQGGRIIDTPGVKGFGTIDFKPEEVAHYFPEIFSTSANCRFSNCTHTHEPGCAVLQALQDQTISPSRYQSYLSILEETKQNKSDKYR